MTRLRDIVFEILAEDGITVAGDMTVVWDECQRFWLLGVNERDATVILKPGGNWYKKPCNGWLYRIPVADQDFVAKIKQVLRGNQGR